ncbi:MAG: putative regulator PrlF [Candidatus Omnitrophica bacterium ADurb.Bin277]|nr:MAG: putative regulator PrlF [Candidatus Omnitrophica bacterium ADurb.Bin277]
MVKLADAMITSQGQVSIPKKVREMLRLQKGSRVDFLDDGKGRVYIQEAETPVEFTEAEWKQFLAKTQSEPVTRVKGRSEALRHIDKLMKK